VQILGSLITESKRMMAMEFIPSLIKISDVTEELRKMKFLGIKLMGFIAVEGTIKQG